MDTFMTDIKHIRKDFPALDNGLAFFDGPGGTQTPRAVADAIHQAMLAPLSNRGTRTVAETNAERIVGEFRLAMADFLNTEPDTIVHGRSATQLTFDFSRHIAKRWSPGDEIVLCRLGHDSNVRPWVIAAALAGAVVRWIDFDPHTTEVDLDSYRSALSEKTRLVALTAASNLLGTISPIAKMAHMAHEFGALVYVDGVHYAAHHAVDFGALGADFFVCSPYKFLGPHCGVLAARRGLLEELSPDKLLPSTNVAPEKFELGTLPYELLSGVTAAVNYIASLAPTRTVHRRENLIRSIENIEARALHLRGRLERELGAIQGVQILSRAEERTSTLLVDIGDRCPVACSDYLASENISVPAGTFYAYEAAKRLELPAHGCLRIGLAPYVNDEDVDRLVHAMNSYLRA
jgi:cysteine desulfurase family protein (TIGR01976 family)